MPGGRPSKLEDPGVRAEILQKVRFAVPPSIAAQAHGVNERTFYRWTSLGRDEKARGKLAGLARQFLQELREAQAYATSRVVLTHTQVALGQTVKREVRRVTMSDDGVHEELIEREFHPPHPGALQWWLERRVPAFYGAVVAKDADSADPDEVMPPASADQDPSAARDELHRLLDRMSAPAGAGPPDPGGLPEPGSD